MTPVWIRISKTRVVLFFLLVFFPVFFCGMGSVTYDVLLFAQPITPPPVDIRSFRKVQLSKISQSIVTGVEYQLEAEVSISKVCGDD